MTTATDTAPSTSTNDTSASGFASLQIVSTSCHGVLNTVLNAPSPKPDWFDDLSNKLDAAKVLANQWIDDIAPAMTASIPSHVIDYGTTYAALTDQIAQLLKDNPNAKGKDDPTVQQVFALIQALHKSVGDIITQSQANQDQLKAWGDAMQKAHDDLYTGAANIQSAEIDLQSQIDKMNIAIQELRAKIDSENKEIVAGAGAIGIGLLALVVGLALAPETGGTSLVVAGVGGLAIIGGAVTWGVMRARINAQFDEIAQDQKNIADDKRQLVALQGLALASGSALTSVATATNALSDVKVMWSVFQNELQGTMDKLDQTDVDLSAIVNEALVLGAQKEWDLAVKFAQQLVGAKLVVESQTLPMAA